MNYPEKLKDSNMLDLFELWLASRPKWLQTAARNLLDSQRMPDEKEVLILAKLCTDEANGIAGLAFASIQPGSLSTSAPRPALRITGLLDVQGVSAIKSGAALSFGSANITVVYGPNGSGILVERCVEKILFNDVLQRFRRSVETKGRIGALAKINPADCAFIDDLMTRYSIFEHSQPDEFPAALPDFDVLSSDVSELAKWIGEFEKRAVT